MRTKILLLIVLSLGTGFFWNYWLYPKPTETLSQADQMKILSELRERYADDCECIDKGNAWHCKELNTNRVFVVKK